MVCCLDLKKSRKDWRIWAAESMSLGRARRNWREIGSDYFRVESGWGKPRISRRARIFQGKEWRSGAQFFEEAL
jgi:hypothetical protein